MNWTEIAETAIGSIIAFILGICSVLLLEYLNSRRKKKNMLKALDKEFDSNIYLVNKFIENHDHLEKRIKSKKTIKGQLPPFAITKVKHVFLNKCLDNGYLQGIFENEELSILFGIEEYYSEKRKMEFDNYTKSESNWKSYAKDIPFKKHHNNLVNLREILQKKAGIAPG